MVKVTGEKRSYDGTFLDSPCKRPLTSSFVNMIPTWYAEPENMSLLAISYWEG